LALTFTLDDIAEEVLVQFLSGNAEQLIHPLPPVNSNVPVICPFIAVPSVEADWYWDYEGTGTDLLPCSPGRGTLSRDVGALFRDFHRRHPATGHSLLNLAEELSGCRVAEIAAATMGRDRFLPCSITTEVSGNGA
jgi:tRNA(Ile)-lysidine synthase TilS/MesJ